MTTTMQQIDAKAMLTGWLQGVTGMYVSDINAIPDDKWTASLGGCTRPCNEISEDAIGFLFWAAMAIKDGATPTIDESKRATLKSGCATKAGAAEMLQKASAMFTEAMNGTTDETLMKTITAPFGMDGSIYSFAQMAVSHIWYHDGQLNYIQCLLGDGDFHWSH